MEQGRKVSLYVHSGVSRRAGEICVAETIITTRMYEEQERADYAVILMLNFDTNPLLFRTGPGTRWAQEKLAQTLDKAQVGGFSL